MKHYDIIIIGAGPAGAMLGRMATGRKIAIIDSRPLNREYRDGDIIKTCGGLLAPQTVRFLNKHNIHIPDDIYDNEQYTHVVTTDFDINVTRKYRRNYKNINREKFDRFLIAGVLADKYFGVVVNSLEYKDGMYIVNNEIAAPILVGADGASSIVRRTFFPDVNFKKYVAIQEVFSTRTVTSYECYFDKSTGDYYGWSLNKNNQTYFGYLISAGGDAHDKFNHFKNKRGFGHHSVKTMTGAVLLRPSFFHPVTCRKNLFLVGEAGGYISPSSAEGISWAFCTAEKLAQADFDVKKFKRKMRPVQIKLFIKNLKSLAMHTPWIRHIIMRFSVGK